MAHLLLRHRLQPLSQGLAAAEESSDGAPKSAACPEMRENNTREKIAYSVSPPRKQKTLDGDEGREREPRGGKEEGKK